MTPQPGEIWRWRGNVSYNGKAPATVTILILKEVKDVSLNGIDAVEFTGHCFDTGERREWFFTKTNKNRWQKVA